MDTMLYDGQTLAKRQASYYQPANLVRIDIRSSPRTRMQSLDQVMLLTDAGIEGEQRAL